MKTKLILVLAIIMGLITTLLFYKYMTQFDQETAINESLIEVFTAKEAIQENQRITSDLLEKTSVSQTGIHQQVIKDSSDAIGKYATSDIAAGEQILSHRLSDEKEENLFISRKVKKGFRAVSVGVNFVQSVSNLIEPEDWVDVVFTKKQTGEDIESKMLLEKVHVLAVGRRMIESNSESIYVEYSSASLELTPQDAVKLVNALESGSIHLILHSRIMDQEGKGDGK